MRKHFVDTLWPQYEVREESLISEHGGLEEKRMTVRAIVQEADIVNQNMRVYPKSVLEAAVAELQKEVNEGRCFGELDHPEFRGKLKNTSHLVKKLWWSDENPKRLCAEFLILNTPSGLVLKEILRAGGRPGISSRGYGEVKTVQSDDGKVIEVVEPGLKLEGFDFVIGQSVPSAKILQIVESLGLRNEGDDVMDLQRLKTDYPALVAELKREAEEGVRKEYEKQMSEMEAAYMNLLEVLHIQLLETEVSLMEQQKITETTELTQEKLNKAVSVLTAIVKALADHGLVEVPEPVVEADEGEEEEEGETEFWEPEEEGEEEEGEEEGEEEEEEEDIEVRLDDIEERLDSLSDTLQQVMDKVDELASKFEVLTSKPTSEPQPSGAPESPESLTPLSSPQEQKTESQPELKEEGEGVASQPNAKEEAEKKPEDKKEEVSLEEQSEARKKLAEYIEAKIKNEKFKQLFEKALANCTSQGEVDLVYQGLKSVVEATLGQSDMGKGLSVFGKSGVDDEVTKKIRESVKLRGGVK